MTAPLSLATATTEMLGLGAVEVMPDSGTVASPGAAASEMVTAGIAAIAGETTGGPVTAPTAAVRLAAFALMAVTAAVIAVVKGTSCASDAGRLLMSAMAANTAELSVATAV